MRILWITWKDRKNPHAGGAELVNEELAKRLIQDGHEVIFLVANFKCEEKEELVEGYKIIRVGNRYSVYFQAWRYYKKYLKNWGDLVIEEINTIPLFTQLYVKKEKRILFIHQLCREIWFYQTFFPLSFIGYLLEPIYLKLLSKNRVITISGSTKRDLIRYGFKSENIAIISVGIELDPVDNLNNVKKYYGFTMLSLGTLRTMKRTHHQIKAFELVKKKIPEVKLKIAGDFNGHYGEKILAMIDRSPYREDIELLGKVDKKTKVYLMQKCHFITVTSIKEGWGLIVTEANSQGTPAIVYNVDGLRDTIKNNVTGLICKNNTPEELARNIINLINDQEKYNSLRKNAWELSKEFSFERSYKEFIWVINSL